MDKGLNWIGNYSRFSYDDDKNDILVLKEQGRPWLDDEINASQEMLTQRFRRMMQALISDGSPDDGFKIVGTGANNNFSVLAGNIHVQGWLLNLTADTSYLGQPTVQTSLTTPGANRTDVVYLDIWYDEVNGVQDPTIVDPTIGARTSCRLRLFWRIRVAEGAGLPVDGFDVNQAYHWHHQLATINRLAGNAAITSAMVQDNRTLLVKTTAKSTRNINASMVETQTDAVVFADAAAGIINYTLPLSGNVEITKTDGSANYVNLIPQGADTILRDNIYILGGQDETVSLRKNGTNWYRKA